MDYQVAGRTGHRWQSPAPDPETLRRFRDRCRVSWRVGSTGRVALNPAIWRGHSSGSSRRAIKLTVRFQRSSSMAKASSLACASRETSSKLLTPLQRPIGRAQRFACEVPRQLPPARPGSLPEGARRRREWRDEPPQLLANLGGQAADPAIIHVGNDTASSRRNARMSASWRRR